jgi:hypothetical protein
MNRENDSVSRENGFRNWENDFVNTWNHSRKRENDSVNTWNRSGECENRAVKRNPQPSTLFTTASRNEAKTFDKETGCPWAGQRAPFIRTPN